MVISLDGSSNTCVVRFSGYGNEEEKNLDDLLPPSKRDFKSPRQSGHHCAQLASLEQNVIVNHSFEFTDGTQCSTFSSSM